MRGSRAAATSRPPQPHASKRARRCSASLVTASNGPAPLRTWWTFTALLRAVRRARTGRPRSAPGGRSLRALLELVDAVGEPGDVHRELQVEARLLGDHLPE